MRKILCYVLTAALVLTPTSTVFAKQGNQGKQEKNAKQTVQLKEDKSQKEKSQKEKSVEIYKGVKTEQKKNAKIKEKKQSFKINGSPVIKYGKYKLPINPIIKGMGATVTFEKETGIIKVTKDTKTIVIDLKNKTVTVNGVADTTSGIFTAKNDKKMTVLIKYIANVLGVRVNVGKDNVTVTVPGLDYPTAVTVTPVGAKVLSNTLNSTILYMTATANIKAGQATGGKAELYVGNKLVATDSTIFATDTTVTFTTSDETPTNEELQAAVPVGGVVTVKLYNATNSSVSSVIGNPTLAVDYIAPVINSINSATYSVSGSALTLSVSGAALTVDKVDVTKLKLYDTTLARTYQLTDAVGTGSTGVVTSPDLITITFGSMDLLNLTGFGTSSLYLYVTEGPFLYDDAGNVSNNFTAVQSIPVNVLR